jgi:hypothetical protein
MHFFLSNLIYYLQVDVIDSEYDELAVRIENSNSFQQVLRAHRNFIANILRLSMVDNLTIQEGIERILQVLTHSLTHSLTYSLLLTHSLTYTHSLTLTHSLTHSGLFKVYSC